VTHYGMSEAIGLAAHEAPRAPKYLGVPQLPEARSYSERTAELIDAEVRRLLEESKARVLATLTEKRVLLDALARLLLEKEVVDRAALDGLLLQRAA
jgi:cell division protease FtsH